MLRPLYEVKIDAETGLWITDPELIGTADWSAGNPDDVPGLHFDRYESEPDDNGRTESRLLRCVLVE